VKRREQSVDENSLERAARLKTQKNLDELGMSASKYFVSFSNTRIITTIDKLGVSLGKDKN
jgi:hypothetical protein